MSSPDPNRPNSQPEDEGTRHLHREDGRTDEEEHCASLAKSERKLCDNRTGRRTRNSSEPGPPDPRHRVPFDHDALLRNMNPPSSSSLSSSREPPLYAPKPARMFSNYVFLYGGKRENSGGIPRTPAQPNQSEGAGFIFTPENTNSDLSDRQLCQLMQGTVEVRASGSRDLFESTFNLHLEHLGLRPPLREPNFDAPTRRDFVNSCHPEYLPRITRVKRDPQGGKLSVELVSDIHGTGEAVNIAPLIQNRYEARRNIPREFVNDTRIRVETNDFPPAPAQNVSINVAEDFPLFYAYWQRNRALIEGFRQNAPPSVQDKCKIVRIAGCASPGCIYVQDANKLENLYEMTKKLTVQAGNNPPYPYDLMSEGNFVAVKIKVDGTWYYRGIIKTVFSYEVVEVVLVDIGITVGVPPGSIRVLPTEYVKVPGFSSRVYLDEPLVPDLTNWPATTKNPTDVFINKHDHQDWLYYFHATQDEVLTFKEYEQEVQFDHEKQRWQVGSRKRARQEKQMNSLREHALIRKLYSAVGGHILCQNKQKKSYPVMRAISTISHY